MSASQVPAIRPVYDAGGGTLAVAEQWTKEREDYIRQTYCGGAPARIAAEFLYLCRTRRLSPEAKQILCVKRGDQWTNQTTIDGFRTIAARTGAYAGADPPVYVDSGKALANGKPYPTSATVTVYRLVQGQRCPFTATVLWQEFNAGQNNWLSMPYHMLAKVARSHALRDAFPEELGGIFTDDEMEQAGTLTVEARDVVASEPASVVARDNTGGTRAPKTPRRVAAAALFAYVRDAMKTGPDDKPDGHAGCKALQAYLYADEPVLRDASLSDVDLWTEAELRTFRDRIEAMHPSDRAMVLAEAMAPSDEVIDVDGQEVNAATGEIVEADASPAVTEREAALIEVRDRAQACRDAAEWRTLAGEVGDDAEAWSILAEEAPTVATVNLLRTVARQAKVHTPEIEQAMNVAARRARQATEATTP